MGTSSAGGAACVILAMSALAHPPVAAAQEVADDTVITLERTSCFGECPVYSVRLDAAGNVTFDGKANVRVVGAATGRIPPSRVIALLATAERIKFFELREHYVTIRNRDGSETTVTDLPTTFVSITRGGRTRRVEDYVGAPPALKELEDQIDQAAGTNRWVRIDEPTLRQMLREGHGPTAEERAELLRKALQTDELPVIKALLENGADPNAPYYGTRTPPLMLARSGAAARALLQAGANPFARNDNGGTPLGSAVYLIPDVTDVLLKAGVSADSPTDASGRTVLVQAACYGNIGVVRLLLKAGANPAAGTSGSTALDCARSGKRDAEAQRGSPFPGTWPFERDFDAVIAVIEQALANRK